VSSLAIKRIVRNLVFFFLFLPFLLVFSDSRIMNWPSKPQFLFQLPKDSFELAYQDYDDYRESQSFWKIFVPGWFGKIIASHVEMMYQLGCFKNLSEEDFDHGHFILRQNAGFFYNSPDEFLKNVAMVMYHTQEGTNLWRKQMTAGVPIEKRTPRSILGFLNGIIRPAAEFVSMNPSQLDSYLRSGTVDSFNVRDTLGLFDRESDLYVAIDWKWHKPEELLCIRPFSRGRYRVDEVRYDILFGMFLMNQSQPKLPKNSESHPPKAGFFCG
jgi:hypothetical protein